MKLTRFFSFFIPIYLVFFALLSYIAVYKIVQNYEKSINNDYSIIVISNLPILDKKEDIIKQFKLKDINILSNQKILPKLKEDLNDESIVLLKKQLPYFYTIKLNTYPTKEKLNILKHKLLTIKGVYKIETFSKNHDVVYTLMLLLKTILGFVLSLIFVFGVFIISNQVKIWYYEENEKLEIISLLGGNIFYGAKSLIKISIFASLLASMLAIGSFIFLIQNLDKIFINDIVTLIQRYYTAFSEVEFIVIILIALVMSLVTIFGVLIKSSKK
jgi:cell division transport system permease protein